MKIFKITLVIVLLFSVIFLGGAFLLPDKQYFTETRTIKTDPVAVFSKIENPAILENIGNEIMPGQILDIEIKGKKKFSEINYIIFSNKMQDPVTAGFVLKEEEDGTKITGYIRIDSLQYPVERWKGFFIPFLYRKNFIEIIDKLEMYLLT